jgi:CBS domain-containing protein
VEKAVKIAKARRQRFAAVRRDGHLASLRLDRNQIEPPAVEYGVKIMKVAEVMTRNIVSVPPDAAVRDIARLMLQHRISGVPVVDVEQRVLGVVSEGDLLRRPEIGTDQADRGWLSMFISDEKQARDFIKSRARTAREVMTQPAICVTAETSLEEAVGVMERHGIKRLPVLDQGRLAGLMTRADIVRAWVRQKAAPLSETDRELHERVAARLDSLAWAESARINVEVEEGVVRLWGAVQSATQRDAIVVAVRSLDGVKDVRAYLGSSFAS